MKRWIVTLSALVLFAWTASCGKSDHESNEEAPPAENIVYGVEFANHKYDWREGGHKIFLAFTDEGNQSKAGDDRWTVDGFCDRAKSSRKFPVVHTFWSGEEDGDKPVIDSFGSDVSEDPFGVADCTGGTKKLIERDASNLILPDMPVTTALSSSALVEFVSLAPRGASNIKITLVSASGADGVKEFQETFTFEGTDAGDHSDIPDDPADAPTTAKNNLIPQASFAQTDRNPWRIRVSLLGLLDPSTSQAIELKANESVFLSENDVPRGIKVSQSEESNDLPVDIVFVLDNSGSMYEEANAISDKLEEFAEELDKSGLDVRFGIVGVNGDITGGHNLTDARTFKEYLSAGPRSGRAEVFGGDDEDDLRDEAGSFDL